MATVNLETKKLEAIQGVLDTNNESILDEVIRLLTPDKQNSKN